ncbi:carboxylesterase/lipase family protein [Mycobacteroides franklinii]|uniref:carboxylesterase/lipase family protein n=1 Tax=Mycobacteroides franklinii TaxID=948102 RepID=UPI000991ECE3|nr:carboxylesterase/lipase family protein [Mycobacteroides franklinii]
MAKKPIRINTANGTVEGFTRGGVHRFRGIPYAEPPVGLLRLRAPRPAQPWTGVRKCRTWGAASIQQQRYAIILPGKPQKLSEDCLTLNVVAPEGPISGPLPVMFFIHGGGYFLGSSATPLYDGASLARQGCVYVSVNYRLGALGCVDLSSLSDDKHTIDSNLYLRDLVLALQWVHDNIGAFGGDPNNVTIFGESAGSHAVNTLLAVPSAGGLFHRAICQSTATGLVVNPEDAAINARQFAKYLGATDANAAETVLSAKPKDLVKALFRLIGSAKHVPGLSLRIGPSIDGDVLPLDPNEAMERGEAHRIPLIIGYNAEEATLFTKILKILPITPQALEHSLSKGGPDFVQRIVAGYDGYPAPKALLKLAGDLAFGSAAWRVAEAHGRHAPTYFYRYDYTTQALRRYGLGPTHAIELLAVFGTYRTIAAPFLAGRKDRATARAVSDEMQSRWLSFARTGVPGDGWPTHTVPDRQVLIIDNPSRLEADPDGDRRPLWQDVASIA